MANVRPLPLWRPCPEFASEVAAAPYDTCSVAEARAEIATRPLSFLALDKPAALFSDEVDEYAPEVYVRARAELDKAMARGVLVPDSKPLQPHYFVYRLTLDGHAQTGVVAGASVADYQSGVIRKHENTRPVKEDDRVEHIKALAAHTGPVLLAYPQQPKIDALLATVVATASALYRFASADGVCHEVWRVDSAQHTARLTELFAALPALYIADGHHRAAAAARVASFYAGEEAQHRAPGDAQHAAPDEAQRHTAEEAQHFLAILFGSNELRILDYNRVVHDLAGHTPAQLLGLIGQHVTLTKQGSEPYRPATRGEYGLYLDGNWYRVQLNEGTRPTDVVDGLDIALLHSRILAPLLDISDPLTSERISYVSGARGLHELASRANKTGGAAFAVFPTSMQELFAVAEAGRLMPPKSTWFEPKPKSGLFIHRLTAL